jgi:hypothetical protein
MKALLRTKGGMAALYGVAGAGVALVAWGPLPGKGGGLLLAFLFWTAVVQGCIAAVAAGTLVHARWVPSLRRELLSVAPLLLLASFLLLLLIPFADAYPWAGKRSLWFRKEFFYGRNLAFLLLAYGTAVMFAGALARGEEGTKVRAGAYLFVFVVSQSLAAFDLVMFLEHPWVSTLFGGYFFIEALYGGFAVSALLSVLLHGARPASDDPEARSDLKDVATLIFGFSLMWAGLFFAQYLTLWYGNIPEEVSFIARRSSASPLRELSAATLFLYFFFPFPALLSTRAKANPYVVSAAALSVLSGIAVERYVFLAPVIRPGLGALAAAGLCFLAVFLLAVRNASRERPGEP